jgi:hypothetical protein
VWLLPLVVALLWAAGIYFFPNRWSTSLFFLLALAPGLFFNTLFHIGASLRTRTYCPSVITALLLYLPVSVVLTGLAYRDHLLTIRSATVLFLLGAVFHLWEVGHNVFKMW